MAPPPADVGAALDGVDAVENGAEVAAVLGYPNADDCPLRSVRLARFDEVAGVLHDGSGDDGAHVVEAVCLQAVFGWYALTGKLYTPARVGRVRFAGWEAADEPLRSLCRLTSAPPGSRRAEATVVDASGRIVAVVEDIEGEPSGAAAPPVGRGPGASVWQRAVSLMEPPDRPAP